MKPLSAGLSNHACLKAGSTAVIATCGSWNDYSLKYVKVIAELCEAGHEAAHIGASAKWICDQTDNAETPATAQKL